jgi:alkylated DNA nucleotide flippase Atl1
MPTVTACAIKSAVGVATNAVDAIHLAAGDGIEGDVARHVSSPRQVLIVRQEDLDAFGLPLGYLKENIAISGLSVDDFRPGKSIRFQGGAGVHLTFHCEPCKTIAARVPNLKSIVYRRGMLGIVTHAGGIAAGDSCRIEPSSRKAMAANAKERVCQVVSCIPSGKVVDYGTLLKAAGLQRVYFRAIPSYLKHAFAAGLPVHRVVTSRLTLPAIQPETVLNAKAILRAELDIDHLERYLWEPKILDILAVKR